MRDLTDWNICAILHLLSAGFSYATCCQAARPIWAAVPALDVVYYTHQEPELRKERRHAAHSLNRSRTCVRPSKQGPVQDTVTRTAPGTTVSGETGEEASSPSSYIAVWDASLVLKPAQPLVTQDSV
jgi:hypothetical protein